MGRIDFPLIEADGSHEHEWKIGADPASPPDSARMGTDSDSLTQKRHENTT